MLYDGANELRSGNVRGGQTGDLRGFDVGMPQHHGMAFDVDAAPPRPAGQLRTPRCERQVLLTVELDQPFQHHRAGGHVDAQSQCLRGEYGFYQSVGEQLFDGVPKHRQQPGVMCRQPAQQSLRHSW